MTCNFEFGVARRSLVRVASRIGLALLMMAGILATVSACTTARPVLSTVFTGVPAEGADDPPIMVTRLPRRETYKKPDFSPPPMQIAEGRPEIDWAGRYAELPKNDAGDVAWTKALESKTITPAAGISADAKDEDPIDMDVELVPAGQAEYKVVFPHKAHTMWMGCPSCHDSIFAMEKGKAKMTMAKLNDGEYCGICHGKVASPDMSGCPACHTAMGKS